MTEVIVGDECAGLGYIEGKNLVLEWRSAEGRYDRTGTGFDHADVIVTGTNPTTRAARL